MSRLTTDLRRLSMKDIEAIYASLMMPNNFKFLDDLPDEFLAVQDLSKEEQVLATLAVVSQYHQLMYYEAPNTDENIIDKTSIPKANLPFLPICYHQLLDKIFHGFARLSYYSHSNLFYKLILSFLEQKGYTLPIKFFKKINIAKTEDIIDINQGIYYQWRLYLKGLESNQEYEELTVENWDDWYPSKRLQALTKIRQSEPAKARLLIEQCAPKMPADQRLKVIEVLRIQLNEEDVDVLKKLASARSSSATQMANRLLYRLKSSDADLADIDEVIQGFVFNKKTQSFIAKRTNNYTKRINLNKILETVNIYQWAKKLNMTIEDFLQSWNFSQNYEYNEAFLNNAVISLDSNHLAILAKRFIQDSRENHFHTIFWDIIKPYLCKEALEEIADDRLNTVKNFFDLLHFFDKTAIMDYDQLCQLPAWKRLIKIDSKSALSDYECMNFYVLGLFIDSKTARRCLEYLYECGISPHEEALAVLHLNALLADQFHH